MSPEVRTKLDGLRIAIELYTAPWRKPRMLLDAAKELVSALTLEESETDEKKETQR